MNEKEGLTERVAKFIVETNLDEIPEAVIKEAKNFFIDTIGCALGGSVGGSSQILMEIARDFGGNPQATVIGGGFKTSLSQGALINGASAHFLDYDDYVTIIRGHASAPVVPVVLALGEAKGMSGRRILEAYIMGVEVELKVGGAMFPAFLFKGWHPTPVAGCLGAASAAAKLLNLDIDRTRMALGIACSTASGMIENFGGDTKSFHGGMAARNGLMAGLMAERGFTASEAALEGSKGRVGFLELYSGGDYKIEKINLGKPFNFESKGATIKAWPSCKGTHPLIEATLRLVEEHNIRPGDISSYEGYTPPSFIRDALSFHEPRTGLEGKFSGEYCIARAIISRKVELEDFTDEKVNEPLAQELIRKGEMIGDDELQKEWLEATKKNEDYTPLMVRIKLKDGREFEKVVGWPRGTAMAPLSKEELFAKYKDCARYGGLQEKNIKRSLELIERLEELKDIAELMATIRPETHMTVPVTKEHENYPSPIPLPQGEGVRGRVKGIFR